MPPSPFFSIFFLSFLFFLTLCTGHPDGTYASIIIEPRSEECFYEELTGGTTFQMDFEVVKGGLLDIACKITRENGHMRMKLEERW